MVVIGGDGLGAQCSFVAGPVFLTSYRYGSQRKHGEVKANGGSFNFFFLLLMFISAVGLIILTVLTAFKYSTVRFKDSVTRDELRLLVHG